MGKYGSGAEFISRSLRKATALSYDHCSSAGSSVHLICLRSVHVRFVSASGLEATLSVTQSCIFIISCSYEKLNYF